jgi:hypothetical protein
MPNKSRIPLWLLRRAQRWRPKPASLAAVAAVRGDPLPLLAIDAYELDDQRDEHRDASARPGEAMLESVGSNSVVGRLLAVNVGLPRDVEWEGKTVRTAV